LKRFVFSLLLFTLSALTCFGEVQEARSVQFTIRYYEKRIYYLGDADHPIRFEAVLTNDSSQTYRFKIADNKLYNLDFEVTTPTNVAVDHSTKFIRSRTANQPVFYREVSLEPGEKYGIEVSLDDFLAIPKSGLYAVQALFYPELNLQGAPQGAGVLRSNVLSLNVRPAVVLPEERIQIEAETGMLLQRAALPPDEVVAYALNARQRSQWEKFFLYLDLESLYQANPRRADSYRRMSEENRRAALNRYREQLQDQTVDQDILVVPSEFEIAQTTYTPSEARVTVIEKFKYPDYAEIRKYTYSLVRRDTIWVITDYDIVNLGTE
jgi:hypothetical protein